MILDIVNRKDPILTTKCEKFDFTNPIQDPFELATNLVETMRRHGAPMIAANEVGINAQVIALESDPALVMFNPVVTDEHGESFMFEETDLSRRGLVCKIRRPGAIRVRFQDYNGDFVLERYIGMTARQILHGTDTTNGVIFYSKANRIHRDKALKDLKKYERSLKRG